MVLQIATRLGFQRFRGEIIKALGGGINKVVSALFFKGLSFIFLFFFFRRIRWLNQAGRSGFHHLQMQSYLRQKPQLRLQTLIAKPECESFAPYDIPVVK
ncbi:hypothetical protein SEET0012_00472 [Salmonella enterica subsp. enterica serovar Tallahassee str. 0012]|nr:hypothetical protein SEET0012_00472 [Salmonella enterica subsp. enterica serovar Tallahassee str. 0012]ESF58520.1 hypothetical protein SEES2008_09563 [Salmonella enterica subsp. enterica serovar Saintpaul str. JO2008]KSB83608.1 hypothetical protein LFZ32_19680 [Salmonella enterica subsp. enterica serovar Newport str. L0167]